MEYQLLKWIHILSATLLFGTGLGSAYYKYMTDRSANIQAMIVMNRNVVLADWIFTTPTIILQPLTGFILMYLGGHDITDTWIWLSVLLYFVAGCCWIPVVFLQITMRNQLEGFGSQSICSLEEYRNHAQQWVWLGVPAFFSIVIVFALMVFKP